jgi:malonyl-CoA O-methyltransferase
MAERLEWIRLAPTAWAHWEPLRGGVQAHALLEQRYPKAGTMLVEPLPRNLQAARDTLPSAWWRRWSSPSRQHVQGLDDASVQMLWANMALHLSPQPLALMGEWHRALAVDGFLMFSCLGPDSLRELRAVYAALGWPPPAPEFTDMHDWGDMLVAAGFAEPVMDMERITLTWATPEQLLSELRELGANLHPARFAALRGRGWRERLTAELAARLPGPDGRLALTFEVVYGHAVKPAPRLRVRDETAVSLQDMRSLLQGGAQGSRRTGK